jgi:hypothetical protein
MALGECSPRAGLQIPLKAIGFELRRELDGDDHAPWPIAGGMNVLSGVVAVQSSNDVAGDTNVVASGVALTSEDVDEAFLSGHARLSRTPRAKAGQPNWAGIQGLFPAGTVLLRMMTQKVTAETSASALRASARHPSHVSDSLHGQPWLA